MIGWRSGFCATVIFLTQILTKSALSSATFCYGLPSIPQIESVYFSKIPAKYSQTNVDNFSALIFPLPSCTYTFLVILYSDKVGDTSTDAFMTVLCCKPKMQFLFRYSLSHSFYHSNGFMFFAKLIPAK